jgi:TonB-linked SusC/RagA family outer membrane protein
VLKGAAAEAIYGSRGANGVIIVTTKNGSNGQNKLTINIYRGYQKATNMIQMLNASQYAKLSNEMLKNNGLPTNPKFANPASLGKGTNWLGHLFRTAPMQNYSVSYSGGNDKTNYYVSGNILHQKGIIKSTGYNRYSIQVNMRNKLKRWLDIGENLTLEHDTKPHGDYNIQNTMAALPTQSVFDNKGNYTSPTGRSDWVGVTKNPLAMTQLIDNNTKGSNILGTIFGKINITDNLSVKSKLGINAKFWDSRTWSPKNDLTPQPQLQSQLFQQFNKSINWLIDNTLTYNRSFKRSNVKLLLGMTSHNSRLNFMNGSIQGFPSDITQQFTNGLNDPTVGGNASSWSLLSYFGRIHYSYKGTYLTTLSLRRDGSSRFGSGNKWGWFPALSVAWRISNEKFFRDVKFINDLKLHFGYGVTGNQDIGNYSFASALQTLKYSFNGTLVSTVVPNVMPNPNVHWESVEQYDLGIEAKLLNDRVEFNADVYIKNTNGMLVPESIPITTGYSDIDVPSINAGKMRNKGLELSVSSQNFRGNFSWSSRFNISFNKNKIVSLNDTIPIPTGSLNGLLN